jgi:hypothetical protein
MLYGDISFYCHYKIRAEAKKKKCAEYTCILETMCARKRYNTEFLNHGPVICTKSVPGLSKSCSVANSSYLPAYEDGRDRVFSNVGTQNSDAGELPRRKHTANESFFFRIFLKLMLFSSELRTPQFCTAFLQ